MALVHCPGSTAAQAAREAPSGQSSGTENAQVSGMPDTTVSPKGRAFLRSFPIVKREVRAWLVFGIVPTLSSVQTGVLDPVTSLAWGSGSSRLRGEACFPAWGHRLRVQGDPGPARCWTTAHMGVPPPPPFQDTSSARGACKAQSEKHTPAFTSCFEIPLICPSCSLARQKTEGLAASGTFQSSGLIARGRNTR